MLRLLCVSLFSFVRLHEAWQSKKQHNCIYFYLFLSLLLLTFGFGLKSMQSEDAFFSGFLCCCFVVRRCCGLPPFVSVLFSCRFVVFNVVMSNLDYSFFGVHSFNIIAI